MKARAKQLRLQKKAKRTAFHVSIPFARRGTTEWHPTERTGPFSTLARGEFDTQSQAHAWARKHLGKKAKYKVKAHKSLKKKYASWVQSE